jgi:hypothetical protein
MKRVSMVALIAVLICTAGYFAYQRYWSDPFDGPGETWTRQSMVSAEDIRLLSSGDYISRSWGDLSSDPWISGVRWKKHDNFVVLEQVHPYPAPAKELTEVQTSGCRALVAEDDLDSDGRVSELAAYFLETRSCPPWKREL